jgi:hypothetical protein
MGRGGETMWWSRDAYKEEAEVLLVFVEMLLKYIYEFPSMITRI